MSSRSTGTAFRVMHQFLLASRTPRQQIKPRSLCIQCSTRLAQGRIQTSAQLSARLQIRGFCASPSEQKKSSGSSKSNKKSPSLDSLKHTDDPHIPENKATRNRDAELDPYDYSELEAGISKAVAKLKDALVNTKDAGRVTPAMIEQLPVGINVKGADTGRGSAHKETAKIGELASVVAKGGRSVNVFCAEEAHVKPITSALLASPYSLVPQAATASSPTSSSNPLLITVPVPPATAETRNLAKQEAKKLLEKANNDIRNARGDAQKRFRKMELGKLVVQDELRKAHKGMEEVVKKAGEEVKKVYEGGLRALER